MDDRWSVSWEGVDPKEEGVREALCTLGNGLFATRGAAEEHRAGDSHYPGTYLAGGYDELSSEVAGRTVVNEDLVNFPNWTWLTFRPADGEWLDLSKLEVLRYRQVLLLDEGLLQRETRFRDPKGRVTRLVSRRLVHMGQPHLAAIEWELTAENWSGAIELRSGIDGAVLNGGVPRYLQLNGKHLETISKGTVAPEGIYLLVRTRQSRIEVAEAAKTRVFVDRKPAPVERSIARDEPERIAETIRAEVHRGEPVRVEKIVSLYSSRHPGISEPAVAARFALTNAPYFEDLIDSHRRAWHWLWREHDVELEALNGREATHVPDVAVLRLHIFHVLQTACRNSEGLDVGVPARGLHGEAYRGHVFWDELFILPFFTARDPSITRSLMLYRYRRLDAARANAREAGYDGAAYPWQSSSDGREATQELHLNPLTGHWGPDDTRLQRHVNAAVVYNVWRYFQATGDRTFLEEYGAEMILEIARFWASLARIDSARGRYDITGVMGPDEYHARYPGAPVGGLRNNAYTNVMAVWCLLRGLEVLEVVGADRREELVDRLGLDPPELARWRDITHRMTVPFHDGVISQFEGYEDLEEFDWEGYRRRYGNIERLDRLLRAEGKSTDAYRVSKQPDVLMLLYLFPRKVLSELFQRLGHSFDAEAMRRNIEYYGARTSHGSTLSRVVFTSILHRMDCEAGSKLFIQTLRSDLHDLQGGTTAEGVHLGAMAGIVAVVRRYYAGLELRPHGVSISPDMPARIQRLHFRVQWHNRWLEVLLTPTRLMLTVDADEPTDVPIFVWGRPYALEPGGSLDLDLTGLRAAATGTSGCAEAPRSSPSPAPY